MERRSFLKLMSWLGAVATVPAALADVAPGPATVPPPIIPDPDFQTWGEGPYEHAPHFHEKAGVRWVDDGPRVQVVIDGKEYDVVTANVCMERHVERDVDHGGFHTFHHAGPVVATVDVSIFVDERGREAIEQVMPWGVVSLALRISGHGEYRMRAALSTFEVQASMGAVARALLSFRSAGEVVRVVA